MFPQGCGFVLVFDYMLSDLAEVIRNSKKPLTEVSWFTVLYMHGGGRLVTIYSKCIFHHSFLYYIAVCADSTVVCVGMHVAGNIDCYKCALIRISGQPPLVHYRA